MFLTHVDDTPLPHGGPEHALPAAVQLGHDDVLGLVGRGAGGEVDAVRHIALLGQPHQEAVVDQRLARACGPQEQRGHLVGQVGAQEEELAGRLHGGDDEVRHLHTGNNRPLPFLPGFQHPKDDLKLQ